MLQRSFWKRFSSVVWARTVSSLCIYGEKQVHSSSFCVFVVVMAVVVLCMVLLCGTMRVLKTKPSISVSICFSRLREMLEHNGESIIVCRRDDLWRRFFGHGSTNFSFLGFPTNCLARLLWHPTRKRWGLFLEREHDVCRVLFCSVFECDLDRVSKGVFLVCKDEMYTEIWWAAVSIKMRLSIEWCDDLNRVQLDLLVARFCVFVVD